MFALAKPCLHGFWTPRMASVSGPVMMRGTWPLPFRKSTVVPSIRVRGGQSFLRGFYGPLRYEPCTQFINVSQRTLHIYWQFSAMSLAIHKIVSKRRYQSYFISRRSPHYGISKDSDLCARAHRCPHYAYARLIARVNSQFTCLTQLFMLQSSDNLQKYEIINNIYL